MQAAVAAGLTDEQMDILNPFTDPIPLNSNHKIRAKLGYWHDSQYGIQYESEFEEIRILKIKFCPYPFST